jgi:hypothetical protein
MWTAPVFCPNALERRFCLALANPSSGAANTAVSTSMTRSEDRVTPRVVGVPSGGGQARPLGSGGAAPMMRAATPLDCDVSWPPPSGKLG